MALESASFISQLNSANPTATDSLSQGDDHIRLVKAALLGTFENFTAAALSSTQAELDAAALAVNTDGVAILADAGVNFKTNVTDGLANPTSGEVDVMCGGVAGLKVTATTVEAVGAVTVDGALTVTGLVTAPGTIPIGGSMPWYTNTLPTAGFGTYAWINGQAVSRTTYATLFAMFGTAYGSGDGTTTFNLPNLQELTLYGRSTMGSASSPGKITNYVLTALGAIIGACTHVLTKAEAPSGQITLNDPGHDHTPSGGGQWEYVAKSGGSQSAGLSAGGSTLTSPTVTSTNTTGITLTDNGADTAHDNVSPGMAVNWVMRIA